ncbi:O-linked beta-N-acetylglucosamine transferase [Synechococcus sp. PROS-U-1]|nr:O-linked beta-N-acetylglucosamine transferase [Synechococcus sp. PROS-U-1]
MLIEECSKKGEIDSRDAINLGGLLRQQGRLKEAEKHYKNTLELIPECIQLRANAINLFIEARKLEEAENLNIAGLKLNPEDRTLLETFGRVSLGKQEYQKAKSTFEKLLKLDKHNINGFLGLGQAMDALGNWEEALEIFQEMKKLHPKDERGTTNQLLMLQRLGRHREAEVIYANLDPNQKASVQIKTALANLLMDKQDNETAERLLSNLCMEDPYNSSHWLNHAATLKALKHNNASCRVIKEGIKREPLNSDLKLALGQSLAEMGRHKAAISCVLEASNNFNSMNATYLTNIQFIGAGYNLIESIERKRIAREWEGKTQREGVGALWGDRIRSNMRKRPLRIGYLSADFTTHPVGRFIYPVLKNHNKNEVTVVGITCGPHEDILTHKIRMECDEWVNINYRTDLEAARILSDKQLDILVELGGYTAHNRLGVLVHKPAPLQFSYLGYYAPTYLKCIDGWIGDKELFGGLNSTDSESHKLLLVKGGYMSFFPEAMPKIAAIREVRQLQFGCFNHARKLTHECIELFCNVMRETHRETKLLLKSISFVEKVEQHRIKKMFAEAGLAEDKLITLPWVEGWDNHMKMYNEIDIALDPIPYGGATTTCEALIMGVPVLSLAGEGMVGRLSTSILINAGLSKWVAKDKIEYINKAKSICNNNHLSKEEREQVRYQLMSSSLGDPKRLARELEKIYDNEQRLRNS